MVGFQASEAGEEQGAGPSPGLQGEWLAASAGRGYDSAGHDGAKTGGRGGGALVW